MMAARRRDRPKPIRAQPRDPVTGKRRSIYGETQREIDARLQRLDEIRRDVRYGLDPGEASKAARPALGTVLTVDEVWQRYASGKKPRARKKADGCWRSYIEPYLSGRRAWELSSDVLARWVLDLGKTRGRSGHGLAPATVWLCYDYLAAAFNRLVPRELPGLPWGGWRPELPRGEDAIQTRREYATTLEQLAALVAAARARDERQWTRGRVGELTAKVVVFLLTGMRQAEVCGLAWDMVHIDGGVPMLHVWAQAPRGWREEWPGATRPPAIPKGRKRRQQVMHASVVAALRAQREQLKEHNLYRPDGPVFPGRDGSWRTSGQAVKPELMRTLAAAAGLPNPHLWVTHSTRHTFATLEVAASLGDFRATKKRTGHSSIKQLEGYYHAATGRGMPSSQIPELAPALISHAITAPGLEVEPAQPPHALPPPAPPPPLPPTLAFPAGWPPPGAGFTPDGQEPAPPAPAAQTSPAEPDEADAPEAAEAQTYADHARAWLAALSAGHVPTGKNGRALARPQEVTEDIRRAQRRVYQRARAAGLTDEQRSRKMAATRRGKLAAWSRALKQAR